jgi:hypothetical protein
VAVVIGSQTHLPDLAGLHGLVGVNRPAGEPHHLRKAGFSYVREFAVLPSLADPRLFIPLDSSAISAGAFGLYAPLKLPARCKLAAARTAARLGLHVWHRDRLLVALREPSPLEQALAELFPGEQVRLALASGSAPPALNRKITVAVLGGDGQPLAFAKLPGPLPISEAGIRNSARVLKALADRPAIDAPRLLFDGMLAGTYAEVTSPLAGRLPGTRFTPAHEQFLRTLLTGESHLLAETEWVRSMVQRRSLLATWRDLDALLDQVLVRLSTLTLPTTIVHGDFAPWNLRLDRGRLRALDWETGSLEGPPLIDRTHYLLSTGYLLRRWTVAEALARLAAFARSAPDGLDEATVLVLQLTYLLDYLLRLLAEGYDDSDARLAWCRSLAVRLSDLLPPARG